jgi:hypothetical protein
MVDFLTKQNRIDHKVLHMCYVPKDIIKAAFVNYRTSMIAHMIMLYGAKDVQFHSAGCCNCVNQEHAQTDHVVIVDPTRDIKYINEHSDSLKTLNTELPFWSFDVITS